MKKAVILHVPHSSPVIPDYSGYVVSHDILEREILKLTDWYTDDLFETPQTIMIRAPFSRIFCDPERFVDDALEVMAKVGMGVLYEKSDEGLQIREVSTALRDQILRNYYWKHHQALENATSKQLEMFGSAFILDCHSYPSKPLVRDLNQQAERPDFNIGTDTFHTQPKWIELSKHFFEMKGYSLGVDWPYKGSIVPMKYYQKEPRVNSMMLEINRALYLNGQTNEKSDKYAVIQTVVHEFVDFIHANLD